MSDSVRYNAISSYEKFVNKGSGRPYFNDKLRLKSLSALACVDYVVLIPFTVAVEAIKCVEPDISYNAVPAGFTINT